MNVYFKIPINFSDDYKDKSSTTRDKVRSLSPLVSEKSCNNGQIKLQNATITGYDSWKLSKPRSEGIVQENTTEWIGHPFGLRTYCEYRQDVGSVPCYNSIEKATKNIIPPSICGNRECLPLLVDSGESCHMTPVRSIVREMIPATGRVTMEDGSHVISVIGKRWTPYLGGILYVPDLTLTLISISKFDKEGFKVRIEDGRLSVHKSSYSSPWLEDLYWLDCKYAERLWHDCKVWNAAHISIQTEEATTAVNEPTVKPDLEDHGEFAWVSVYKDKSLEILHKKWGHVSMGKTRHVLTTIW